MLTKIEVSLAGAAGALCVLLVWSFIQWLWSRRSRPDRCGPTQPSGADGPRDSTSAREEEDVPVRLRRPLSSHPRETGEDWLITRKHSSASRPSTDPNERLRHAREAQTSPTRARSVESLEERATLMFMPAVADDPERGPPRTPQAVEQHRAREGQGP